MVDGLCGREPPNRGDYGTTWTLEEWLELLNSLIALFCLAVGNNSSDKEVRQRKQDAAELVMWNNKSKIVDLIIVVCENAPCVQLSTLLLCLRSVPSIYKAVYNHGFHSEQ